MSECPKCHSNNMEYDDTDEDFEEGYDLVMVTKAKCSNCGTEFTEIERTKKEIIITKSDLEANFLKREP